MATAIGSALARCSGAAFLLVGTIHAPAVAAGSCSIGHFNFVFGSDTQTTIITKAGARCMGHITGRTAVSGGSVAQPPAHGRAFIDGHQFGYQSVPGYAGQDAFTIALTGTSYRRGRSGSYALDGTTNISFAVQVAP